MKPFFYLLFAFAFSCGVKATTWKSIAAGFWSDASIWQNGIAPPTTTSDTFYIKHPIVFSSNLYFQSGAVLRIDSSGGLCAHKKISILSGSKLLDYGIIEADTLHIKGGQANLYASSGTTLTCYGIISNGGSMFSSGAMVVGPWFNCRSPEFSFAGMDELNLLNEIRVFPNPAQSILKFDYPAILINASMKVTNLNGKTILESQLSQFIDVSALPSGIYFLSISDEYGKQKHFKILKE